MQHTCYRCGKSLDPFQGRCPECRAKHRKWSREARYRRRQAGLCMNCNQPAVPGKSCCEYHLEYYRAYARKFRKRLQEALEIALPDRFPRIDLTTPSSP